MDADKIIFAIYFNDLIQIESSIQYCWCRFNVTILSFYQANFNFYFVLDVWTFFQTTLYETKKADCNQAYNPLHFLKTERALDLTMDKKVVESVVAWCKLQPHVHT